MKQPCLTCELTRGLSVMCITSRNARLLAEGKGDRQDKREHLQALARMARGIATKLPYDPARREREEECTI
jgi:hypothetical protein